MRSRFSHQRHGVQALEAILVIPVLVVTLAAMVQFGSTSTVLQAVESAADEIARELAKVEVRGGNFATDAPAIARDVANEVLSVHGLSVDAPRTGVRVIFEDSANTGSIGDLNLTPNNAPANAVNANEVRVTVLVSFDPGGGNPDPVPNVLSFVGLTFTGKQFEVVTTAFKE